MRLDHLLSRESGARRTEMFFSADKGKGKASRYCLILRALEGDFKREKRNLMRERGGVAQLGEHLLCKQGVRSSSLLISTNVGS